MNIHLVSASSMAFIGKVNQWMFHGASLRLPPFKQLLQPNAFCPEDAFPVAVKELKVSLFEDACRLLAGTGVLDFLERLFLVKGLIMVMPSCLIILDPDQPTVIGMC